MLQCVWGFKVSKCLKPIVSPSGPGPISKKGLIAAGPKGCSDDSDVSCVLRLTCCTCVLRQMCQGNRCTWELRSRFVVFAHVWRANPVGCDLLSSWLASVRCCLFSGVVALHQSQVASAKLVSTGSCQLRFALNDLTHDLTWKPLQRLLANLSSNNLWLMYWIIWSWIMNHDWSGWLQRNMAYGGLWWNWLLHRTHDTGK